MKTGAGLGRRFLSSWRLQGCWRDRQRVYALEHASDPYGLLCVVAGLAALSSASRVDSAMIFCVREPKHIG